MKPGDASVRPAAGRSSDEVAAGRQRRPAGAGLLLSACARPTCRRIAGRGRSRPTTTSRGTSCCCGTSRPATTARRGTPCGCPIARPIRTTMARSRPTTSAGTTTIRMPTTPRARRSSPTIARISRACCGRSPITRACRRKCAPSSSGSAWPRTNSSTTTTGRRSSTSAKRGG